MEERDRVQPLQHRDHRVTIDQKASEEKVEEHHEGSNETGHADRLESDGKEEDDTGGGQVEEDEGEHKLPEGWDGGYEANEAVDDARAIGSLWAPLFEKVGDIMKIVDGLADVRKYQISSSC